MQRPTPRQNPHPCPPVRGLCDWTLGGVAFGCNILNNRPDVGRMRRPYAGCGRSQASGVGWVEQSETQHQGPLRWVYASAATQPTIA